MSVRNLEYLFRPGSIAVIGASNEPQSIGATLMRNLLRGGFSNPIMPVNPKRRAIAGVLAYPSVASLPIVPDLAIIATPAPTVPGLVAELGERGTRAALVVTSGVGEAASDDGRSYQQQIIEAAQPHLLRILGPDCVGLIIPNLGLNASLAHRAALPGKIAFITQSRALASTVLDWAHSKDIGFSHFLSLGKGADVDFGDILDYLSSEPTTRSILLYIESLTEARKFMSAARAAARNKPVAVIKAGRMPEAAMAAVSHTGALAGADDVFDTAIRRAGMLRVYTIDELFAAVETLARARPGTGERLAIVSNGGGPGVMATDHLIRARGRLAELSEQTRDALKKSLASAWSQANPLQIPGNASIEQYVQIFEILLKDRQVDALAFIHAPTAMVPSERIAEALVPLFKSSKRRVLSCWLGVDSASEARRIFSANGISTYRTPEEAVGAFMQEVDYHRNHAMLMETPPSLPDEFEVDKEMVRELVRDVLATGRQTMTEPEARAVLAAYGIPVVETRIAANADEAIVQAQALGFPVAVKLLSQDINHKSDIGGVVLDVDTADAVRSAVEGMVERLRALKPEACIDGFLVQQMARRPGAHELIVGAITDAVFGPVILFGRGGVSVEVTADRAVALPPLNLNLARELVSRTRVSRLLAGYRNQPPTDREAIYRTLLQISQLVTDIPEIGELDINPILADEHGVIALDARIYLVRAEAPGPHRLAIRPYPSELEEVVDFHGRSVLFRPIRPEDEPAHREFFSRLKSEDVRYRFFHVVRALAHSELARLTQIDYDREMAFIATADDESGQPETLGVVRVLTDPDNRQAEFAIIVRSDLKGKGLGPRLMEKIVRYCRERGTEELVMSVMAGNRGMRGMAERFNFESVGTEDGVTELRLRLN
jgi:acetyltransferase